MRLCDGSMEYNAMTTAQLIAELRELARVGNDGKAGHECVVDKKLLSAAADRLDAMSAVLDDTQCEVARVSARND